MQYVTGMLVVYSREQGSRLQRDKRGCSCSSAPGHAGEAHAGSEPAAGSGTEQAASGASA